MPTSIPKDERIYTDPSLRPPGFPPIPEASDVKPEPMPQLDGHHDEGGLEEERPLQSSSSSPNRKTTSESRLFKTNDGQSTEDEHRLPRKRWEGASRLLPQLDGEGDEEELGDATIHDLDEQMDLSHNQSLDAAEENIEDADSLAKSMEGVKIRVSLIVIAIEGSTFLNVPKRAGPPVSGIFLKTTFLI